MYQDAFFGIDVSRPASLPVDDVAVVLEDQTSARKTRGKVFEATKSVSEASAVPHAMMNSVGREIDDIGTKVVELQVEKEK